MFNMIFDLHFCEGLFAVLVTLGTVPVIQTPRGGPAEMVASKLFDRVRFNLASANSLFSGGASGGRYQRGAATAFERPLLVSFIFSWYRITEYSTNLMIFKMNIYV